MRAGQRGRLTLLSLHVDSHSRSSSLTTVLCAFSFLLARSSSGDSAGRRGENEIILLEKGDREEKDVCSVFTFT